MFCEDVDARHKAGHDASRHFGGVDTATSMVTTSLPRLMISRLSFGAMKQLSSGFNTVGTLPDPTQAIIVLAVYTLVLGTIAFLLFERRDVQGATAG